MININLLKYFDKSFSEIYKIEHETEISDKKALLKNIFIALSTSKNVYLPILIFLLILFAYTSYNLWTTISKNNNRSQMNEKTNTAKESPTVKKNVSEKEVIPVTIDNDTQEMKNTEQKTDTDIENTEKQRTVAKKNDSLKNNTKTNMPQPAIKQTKNENNKKERQNKKSYVIIVKGLDKNEIDNMQKLSETYGVKISKTLNLQEKKELWHVYTPDEHSNTLIGDIKVKIIATFKDKSKAVNFAENREGRFFIKKENVTYKEYNVKIEGFESINKAKQFAEKIK